MIRRTQSKLVTTLLIGGILLVASCSRCSHSPSRTVFGEVDVNEIDLASRVPARISKIHVKLGDRVKAGDILVELEGDVIAAQRGKAEAAIEAAKNQRDIAKDAVRKEELQQLEANLSAMEKQKDLAEKTLGRMKELLKEGAISQQKYDEAETGAHGAKEKYLAALAQYKLGKEGARKESRNAAEAVVNQAESSLKEVSAYEKDLTIRATVDGEVFAIPHEVGELVPQGYPIVTLMSMEDSWIVVQVPEDALLQYKKEAKIKIDIPSLSKKGVDAEVSYIAALPSYATLVYTKDKSSFDLKMFEVRLRPSQPVEGLRPGMTVKLDL